MRLLLSRPRDEVRPGHPARQAGGGDAPRGRLPDPLGLPDQLVVGRAAPGGRFGPLGAGGPLRLLLRGGRSRGVALLLLLAAATAEPVGLQRVVQRGTAVAGTGRRGQGLRLAPDRPLLEKDTEILARRLPAELLDRLGENSVNEVLLTAVAWTLARWAGTDSLALDVEGHGRLDAQAPVDLSRTVGWFTAIAPVRIDLSGCAVPAAAVSRVRRELDGLRGRDQEWGLLRYGGACPAGHPLLSVPERQVSYNYLGFFDGAGPEPDALFAAVPGSLGAEASPEGERHYLIDVAAVVADGELELAVKFSPEVHPAEEVRALLDRCAEVLEELLADGGAASGTADVDHAELLLALEEVSLGDD
ncbi:hypothetical protein JTP67_14920 [Streptomyces sp. S12]|nr:hypothetical protein [Streptomyces sp. S12]